MKLSISDGFRLGIGLILANVVVAIVLALGALTIVAIFGMVLGNGIPV